MTEAERFEKRRIARETLNSDRVSQQIFEHFLALSMANPQGFDLESALQDHRWTMKEGPVKAFKEHQKRYLSLLTDALPDFAIRGKIKPVLEEPDTKWIVVDKLEDLPEKARAQARVRDEANGEKKFVVTQEQLLAAMGVQDGGAPPPAPKKAPDAAKFEISSVDVQSNFDAYRELREKAVAAGQSVRVID